MSDLKSLTASMLRIDTSRTSEYLYADKPKLSFFQKLGRGFGKAVSFLGPIGAAVTAIAVPGVGIPIAAGIYGMSQIAGDMTSNALAKDAAKMSEYNSQMANSQVSLPGLFEGQSASEMTTDFIAPSQYGPGISQALINRQAAIGERLIGY
jgi:hypothetical protein